MLPTMGPGMGVECPTPSEFVSSIVESHPRLETLGSFSKTVYDSAWLSMVYKSNDGQVFNLFPECFEYILKEQSNDGGWRSYGSSFDGILNSLAALLALVTYRTTCGSTFKSIELEPRIQSATAHVQILLIEWDVDSTVQVGFEVLVTGLLKQLQAFEVNVSFPGLPKLETLYSQKMKRLTPEVIYSKRQTTILHSLEALVGVIDFDLVKHHCAEETGILGSPASTAAYLIHSKEWDTRAETYLRTALEASNKHERGGVPSGFPSCVFEISWVCWGVLDTGRLY
jgi:hypothetical protein